MGTRFFLGILVALVLVFVGIAPSSKLFGVEPRAKFLNLPEAELGSLAADEDEPELTDRVARISFTTGESKIRRLGSEEWERVTQNLPIVEGDELVTDADARLEIQFSRDQHLRLAENAYLRIVNLKDEGIAVSLSLGTLSLRIARFDKESSFFEIDAPKTTLAVKAAGSYRVDAGIQEDSEVRLTATEGGEARVYSDNAGFTLKDGRSARIFTAGARIGEWETTAAARYRDDFTMWSAERESVVANRIKNAYYDRYYDSDIYGAEDLNDNGDWIHTRNYGYVWRPSRIAISHYSDWSPYRYGHWRWVPPYGWTWVNDEPWGWSTYHHGRWFYDDGYWNWSPYGYYRQSRSWWSPALVFISVVNNNICWYPLPYHRPRQVYNHNGFVPKKNKLPIVIPPNDIARKLPKQNQNINVDGKFRKSSDTELPIDRVPPTGVVTIDAGAFGTKVKGIRTAPIGIAKSVLAKTPDDGRSIDLPNPNAKIRRINSDIAAERPKIDVVATRAKVGAALRKGDAPMDNVLRETRIYGNRSPLKIDNSLNQNKSADRKSSEPRDTGVVQRRPSERREIPFEPEPRRAKVKDPSDIKEERQIKQPGIKTSPRYDPPVQKDRPQYEPPPQKERPRYEPPAQKERPRYEQPPPVRERPRVDTPPPVKEPQRNDPPAKSTPKPDNPQQPPSVPRKVKPDDGNN